jgi:hypothetical protein
VFLTSSYDPIKHPERRTGHAARRASVVAGKQRVGEFFLGGLPFAKRGAILAKFREIGALGACDGNTQK